MKLRLTLWGSLYNIDDPREVEEAWPEVISRLSHHFTLSRKEHGSGFGPYFLQMPGKACARHQDAKPRPGAHRCDSCVENVTLAVYDADTGTRAQVQRTESLLTQAHIARLWYSTFSHTLAKPSYRLVIPLARPVPGVLWQDFRYSLLKRFEIPADPLKCTGLSHFYFLPACPQGSTPEVWHEEGAFLEPESIPDVARRQTVSFADTSGFNWEPPQETGEPVDMDALQAELKRRATLLARKGEHGKATALRRLLKGEPLAEKGERNSVTFRVAGMLPWTISGHPLSSYRLIMRESVEAMAKAGSSLTLEKVERMLLTAMRNKAERDYLAQETERNQQAELDSFRRSIYRAAGLEAGNESNEAS